MNQRFHFIIWIFENVEVKETELYTGIARHYYHTTLPHLVISLLRDKGADYFIKKCWPGNTLSSTVTWPCWCIQHGALCTYCFFKKQFYSINCCFFKCSSHDDTFLVTIMVIVKMQQLSQSIGCDDMALLLGSVEGPSSTAQSGYPLLWGQKWKHMSSQLCVTQFGLQETAFISCLCCSHWESSEGQQFNQITVFRWGNWTQYYRLIDLPVYVHNWVINLTTEVYVVHSGPDSIV